MPVVRAWWRPLVACLGLTSSSLLPQRDCQNYVKILLPLNSTHLFACGTAAFSPLCTYVVSAPPCPGSLVAGLGAAALSASGAVAQPRCLVQGRAQGEEVLGEQWV